MRTTPDERTGGNPVISRLHRTVAEHDYSLGWLTFFLVVRLLQMGVCVYVLVRVVQWGLS